MVAERNNPPLHFKALQKPFVIKCNSFYACQFFTKQEISQLFRSLKGEKWERLVWNMWRYVRSHFPHPSDSFRHSDNNYCLKRGITELAWTLTKALWSVGFWRLQYLWGKETYQNQIIIWIFSLMFVFTCTYVLLREQCLKFDTLAWIPCSYHSFKQISLLCVRENKTADG